MVNFLEISFFVRVFTALDVRAYPFVTYHSQNYFGIVIYLLLAATICALLATLAYLFSLSSVQDSEKRSEYECGFEPFDSATRLPFDVHFYLVGILFLIFDVEIALLFPWVLGLHTAGWFSFYVVLGFIVLLGVGFLYEWKRGALIWPSRQVETPYSSHGRNNTVYTTSFEKQNGLPHLAQFAKQKSSAAAGEFGRRPSNKNLRRLSSVTVAFKKIMFAKRIAHTTRLLLRCRFTTFSSYVSNVAKAEIRLSKYRKAIYFFIKNALIAATACRISNPRAEPQLIKQERVFYTAVAPVSREYASFSSAYKGIYKKFKSSLLVKHARYLSPELRKKVKFFRRYLFLQKKYFGLKNGKAKREKRSLRKQINPQRKFHFRRPSYYKAGFAYTLSFIFNTETLFINDLISEFLPEMLLIAALLLNLVLLAIGLGEGQSKKVLVIESFFSLSRALLAVAILYFMELLMGVSSGLLLEGFVSTSAYVVATKLLTVLTGRFILVESNKYIAEHSRHLLEFPLVMTTAVFFMLLLVGSNHLVSAFLSLVGFSLNLYVLVLFDAPAAVAREAGVKYFYLSTISSGLILYGIFLLYALLGTGNFYEIQQLLAINLLTVSSGPDLLSLAVVFLLVGLFFKLAAFPGHLWAADVYEGSPDPITAFFMLPVKVAVLGFVIQLLTVALEPAAALWQPIVALSAAVSLVWGCFAALAERKTKRFLAYASINQIGFLLLGLATASQEGYRATIFYLLLYSIMNVAFLVVFLNARRSDKKSLVYLTDFRGFGLKYVAYSWSVAVVLLSMAGIPPLAGFFGKYYLLLHAQEQGLTFIVVIGLATSLISTYYYLRLIKIFWFEGSDGVTAVNCDLTLPQSAVLTFSECLLWVLSAYTAYIGMFLDYLMLSAYTDYFHSGF